MRKIVFIFFMMLFIAGCVQNDAIEQVNGQKVDEQQQALEEQKMGQENQENGKKEEIEKDQEVEGEHEKDNEATSGLQKGQIPPSLALETLSGEIFSEAKLEGKKVVINFWASWCGPCRMEMPDMVRFAQEYNQDVVVLAVNVAEDITDVKPFVEEFGMDFPVLLDRTGELTAQYQVLAIPTTYFLHSDGTVAIKHTGVLNYSQFVHAYQGLE
jgi:thiol-disulfide isomerase/thioredoxin